MNFSCKKLVLSMCAYLGFAASAGAGSATQGANSTTDEALRERVQAALHSDRYLYDGHIRVSVDKGVVALHGLVFSASDLQDAMHIAEKAAQEKRVVDDLSIDLIESGRR